MKNFKKNVLIVCALVCATLFVFAGGSSESLKAKSGNSAASAVENPKTVHIAALNGSSGIGMAYLFENPPLLTGTEGGSASAQFETVASADVLLPKLLKGEVDIGILPPNVAAKVFAKNNEALVVGAVVGNGMLNLITRDTHIKTLSDLSGKKITVAAQGATPEYVLRYLLQHAGVQAELDFSIPTAEIAAALVSGKIEYAFVPEPFATVAVSKSSDIIRALDVQSLWASIPGNSANYPMTVVVIRTEFAQKYPELVRSFLTEYKHAILWTNSHPKEAGALTEKHMLGLTASVAAAAIPNANFVYIDAVDARSDIEQLLSVFLQFAPEAIGGSLPKSEFYFK